MRVKSLRVLGLLCLMLVGCTDRELEPALEQLQAARRELRAGAENAPVGPRAETVEQAQQALWDAELALRREHGRWFGFLRRSPWRSELNRALDLASLAVWVADRDRAAAREEAQARLEAAKRAVESCLDERNVSMLPAALRARLRESTLAISEAARLMDRGDFELALEKAGWAEEIADLVRSSERALTSRLVDPGNLSRWASWIDSGMRESRAHGRAALVVDKRRRRAFLFERGTLRRSFDVDLGFNGLRQKHRARDGATPEGLYRVILKRGPGETIYYKALLLDYPNESDRRRFREAKAGGHVPATATPGGAIEIHGGGGQGKDWTDGCVAVANKDMDHLFERLAIGSPIVIVGSVPSPWGDLAE